MKNRELKFRIWCKRMKRWLCEDSQYLQMDGKKVHAAPWSTIEFDTSDENYVIQQYTGLIDKNKKEVYEGDILDSNDKSNPVEFVDGKFVINLKGARIFDLCELYEDGFKPTVVGNIFENYENN